MEGCSAVKNGYDAPSRLLSGAVNLMLRKKFD